MLEDIINDNPVMNHSFNSCDKGHIDDKRKYINKQKISYKVSLEDLNVYFKDRVVLYFQIFISEGEKERNILFSFISFKNKILSK